MKLRPPFRQPVRNVEIGELQDVFLVSAVAMILVIRLQLWATNYPQLGGGKLHIAHLLWGGLLMLIALGILLSFLGRSLRVPAAVVGGVGFGFFIDELGKFITSDNDYFYKPTAALIYVVFIVLFLITRAMQRRRGFSPREYLVNAMDLTTDAARRDLDVREKRRALELLEKADQDDPLVGPLRRMLQELDAIPARQPRRWEQHAAALRDWYFSLVIRPRFARVVGWLFVLWALASVFQILAFALELGYALGGSDAAAVTDRLGARVDDLSVVNLAGLGSSAAAGLLVISGVLRLRAGDRVGAYQRFDRALLVSIFITQVFAFAESEFSAVFGLGLDILLLVTVRAMLRSERHLEREGGPSAPTPGAVQPEAAPAG